MTVPAPTPRQCCSRRDWAVRQATGRRSSTRSRRRYRVVAYDQAGTGRTGGELPANHSIAAMADEAAAVLDASKTTAAHFVGHALGGLVGLALAQRQPERLRSLTVVNGWAAIHSHTRRCFDVRLALLKHEGPPAYVRSQPIFLFPADWLARNEGRVAQEEAHGLAGFQGVEQSACAHRSPARLRCPAGLGESQAADLHRRGTRRCPRAEHHVAKNSQPPSRARACMSRRGARMRST